MIGGGTNLRISSSFLRNSVVGVDYPPVGGDVHRGVIPGRAQEAALFGGIGDIGELPRPLAAMANAVGSAGRPWRRSQRALVLRGAEAALHQPNRQLFELARIPERHVIRAPASRSPGLAQRDLPAPTRTSFRSRKTG
jgi:hypothetical protein